MLEKFLAVFERIAVALEALAQQPVAATESAPPSVVDTATDKADDKKEREAIKAELKALGVSFGERQRTSYLRDLLMKKDKNKKWVALLEAAITDEGNMPFVELAGIWKFLNDAHKRLGIDDVGKQEDEEDYKTAVLEGLFD